MATAPTSPTNEVDGPWAERSDSTLTNAGHVHWSTTGPGKLLHIGIDYLANFYIAWSVQGSHSDKLLKGSDEWMPSRNFEATDLTARIRIFARSCSCSPSLSTATPSLAPNASWEVVSSCPSCHPSLCQPPLRCATASVNAPSCAPARAPLSEPTPPPSATPPSLHRCLWPARCVNAPSCATAPPLSAQTPPTYASTPLACTPC